MRTEEKANVKNGVAKMLVTLLALVIQVGGIVLLVVRLNEYSASISLLTSLVAFLLAVYISGKRDNAAFKLSWIILIMAFPLLGLCLYLLFGRSGTTRRTRKRFEVIDGKLRPYQRQQPEPPGGPGEAGPPVRRSVPVYPPVRPLSPLLEHRRRLLRRGGGWAGGPAGGSGKGGAVHLSGVPRHSGGGRLRPAEGRAGGPGGPRGRGADVL